MLRVLEKERLLFIDRRPKQVGGIAIGRIIARCFGRLSNCVQLARNKVLRADFPQIKVAQAFGAVRLRTRHEQREIEIVRS